MESLSLSRRQCCRYCCPIMTSTFFNVNFTWQADQIDKLGAQSCHRIRQGQVLSWLLTDLSFVIALQAHDVGRLMGYGGRRIRRISQDTGCCIVVGRKIPLGEPVPIDVYAEHQSELSEAVQLIAECFEDDKDGLDTDEEDAHDSVESDSDAEDSSTVSSGSTLSQRKPAAEVKPRQHYSLKGTYVVSGDMVRVLVPEELAAT